MSTKRIGGPRPWGGICRDPEHSPPSHRVWQPGTWEHTCPSCGNKVVFVIPARPTLHGVSSQRRPLVIGHISAARRLLE